MEYKSLKWLGGRKPKSPEYRFEASYKKDTNGCWIWQGKSQNNYGYGKIKVNGKNIPAHRFSWALINGDIPKDQYVLHKCDVPKCVNPDHLFLGTLRDNMQDCISKGRFRGGTKTPLKGMASPSHKLTDDDVIAIRADNDSQRKIAAKYGVTQTLIHNIKARKTWRHV